MKNLLFTILLASTIWSCQKNDTQNNSSSLATVSNGCPDMKLFMNLVWKMDAFHGGWRYKFDSLGNEWSNRFGNSSDTILQIDGSWVKYNSCGDTLTMDAGNFHNTIWYLTKDTLKMGNSGLPASSAITYLHP
jgi:hypothetical protein